jgi:hypothetical protein
MIKTPSGIAMLPTTQMQSEKTKHKDNAAAITTLLDPRRAPGRTEKYPSGPEEQLPVSGPDAAGLSPPGFIGPNSLTNLP